VLPSTNGLRRLEFLKIEPFKDVNVR